MEQRSSLVDSDLKKSTVESSLVNSVIKTTPPRTPLDNSSADKPASQIWSPLDPSKLKQQPRKIAVPVPIRPQPLWSSWFHFPHNWGTNGAQSPHCCTAQGNNNNIDFLLRFFHDHEHGSQFSFGIPTWQPPVPLQTTSIALTYNFLPHNNNNKATPIEIPIIGKPVKLVKPVSHINNNRNYRLETTTQHIGRYRCNKCCKSYSNPSTFQMHLKTHLQGCVCPVCHKTFSRHWLLQGHLRTHTGEKPFACPVCSKAFADKSNMRAHAQIHSGLKPFSCARCGKSFALKSYLSKHEESSCVRGGTALSTV